MVQTAEQALEGGTHTQVTPRVGDVDERMGKSGDGGIERMLLIGIFHYAGGHGLLGPALCYVGFHLDDVQGHTQFQGVGQTDVAVHRPVACHHGARCRAISLQDLLDGRFVPSGTRSLVAKLHLLVIVFQASHDAVQVLDDTIIYGLHVVVLGWLFGVLLVLYVGERTGEVGFLLCGDAIVEQVDGLDFGNGVNSRVIEERHEGILHHSVGSEGIAVEFFGNIVGRGERTVHEVLVRYGEVLRISVGTEAILALVGVCLGHISLLGAAQAILSREALVQVLVFIKRVDTCLHFLGGEGSAVAERVGVAVVDGGLGRALVHGKFGAGVIVVQARLDAKGGNGQGAEENYFFHDDSCF